MAFIQRRPGQDGIKSYKTLNGSGGPSCGCCGRGVGAGSETGLPSCACRETPWHPGCTQCPDHCGCVPRQAVELRIRAPRLDPGRHHQATVDLVDVFKGPAKAAGEEIEVDEITLRRIVQEEVGTAMKRLLASVRPQKPEPATTRGGGEPVVKEQYGHCERGLVAKQHPRHRGSCPGQKRGEVLAARLDRTCKRPGSEGLPEHAKHLGRSACPRE